MGMRASRVLVVFFFFVGCGGGTSSNDAGQDRGNAKDAKKDVSVDVAGDSPSASDVAEVAPGTCRNRVKDGDETGVDCGGSCPSCAVGTACQSDQDWQSKSCGGGMCDQLHCTDG